MNISICTVIAFVLCDAVVVGLLISDIRVSGHELLLRTPFRMDSTSLLLKSMLLLSFVASILA